MTRHSRNLALLAIIAAGLIPATAALARSNSTTKIVREAPVILETTRYVDDAPRVIERRNVVESAPVQSRRGLLTNNNMDAGQAVVWDGGQRCAGHDGKRGLFHAEAEITVIGPDRMNIRPFRKRHSPRARR